MIDGRTSSSSKGERAYDIVIPTVARPSLDALLLSLAATAGPMPGRVFVVDDRKADGYHFVPIDLATLPPEFAARVTVLRSHGMGPAFARNVGWSASRAVWIAFLDDDIVVDPAWPKALALDLDAIERESDASRIAGSYGRVSVPLPGDRRPTAYEAHVVSVSSDRHAAGDAVLRRTALETIEGFDTRFPHAHRESSELAIRLERSGYRFAQGARTSTRLVRAATLWSGIALESNRQDDAIVTAIHGHAWQDNGADERATYGKNVAITAAALDGLAAALEGRTRAALGYGLAWAYGTALLAARRIAPGPRTSAEIATALATSLVLPFASVYHYLLGERIAAGLVRPRIRAVLFDREGTLVHDAPIGADARRVVAMPGALAALERARAAQLRVGVLATVPGLASGSVTPAQNDVVHARIGELLGPFDTWAVCAHAPDATCACRKPKPDLVLRAARDLGVSPEQCVVIGDTRADLAMARAAGAFAILVPTASTPPEDVASATHVARTLDRAIDIALSGRL